jgi:hypothetical protein
LEAVAVFMPLRRSIVLSLAALASLSASWAVAEPMEIQQSDFEHIFGRWFVTSFEIAPIAATSLEQAAAMVGKIAYFDRSIVKFGSQECPEPRYQGASPLSRNESIEIVIDCPEGQIVPNLALNRENGQLFALLDGAAYRLGREPPKKLPQ